MTMHRVRTWKEIRDEIDLDDKGKFDLNVPIENVRMNNIGDVFNMLVSEIESDTYNITNDIPALTPNEHALGQLFQRTGIDARYGRKCYESDPMLIADHVNYWIESGDLPGIADTHKNLERNWFLRAKNESLRAVLTDRYGTLDNRFVFNALSTVLKDEERVGTTGFYLDSKYLNTRMTFPQAKVNIGTEQKPDFVFVGFHFKNSEVGSSSLLIDSCLYREICKNGLIVRVGGEGLLKQRHSNIGEIELQSRVNDAINKAIAKGNLAIDVFAQSQDIKIKSPLDTITELCKQEKYSKAMTDTITNSYNNEPNKSVFGVVNAFTHAAQQLPIEQRLEMETFAGEWMQKSVKAGAAAI